MRTGRQVGCGARAGAWAPVGLRSAQCAVPGVWLRAFSPPERLNVHAGPADPPNCSCWLVASFSLTLTAAQGMRYKMAAPRTVL